MNRNSSMLSLPSALLLAVMMFAALMLGLKLQSLGEPSLETSFELISLPTAPEKQSSQNVDCQPYDDPEWIRTQGTCALQHANHTSTTVDGPAATRFRNFEYTSL